MTAVVHRRSRPWRGLTAGLLIMLLAAAGWALWRSAQPTPVPADQRVVRLAASLRCPACAGQSVAESQSPVAAAMRQAVVDQVRAGRSDRQIRDWFVQRYGADVLLDPSGQGIGLVLWLVPAAVLLAGSALVVHVRRRSPAGPQPASVPDQLDRPARAVWALCAAGVLALVGLVAMAGVWTAHLGVATAGAAPAETSTASAGTEGDPVAAAVAAGQALENQGRFAAAAAVYQEGLSRAPREDLLRLHLGFALLRAGQPAAAEAPVRDVLAARRDQPDALLVLGLAQRALKDPAATGTLHRFLQIAPDHAAAAQVRRLLASD